MVVKQEYLKLDCPILRIHLLELLHLYITYEMKYEVLFRLFHSVWNTCLIVLKWLLHFTFWRFLVPAKISSSIPLKGYSFFYVCWENNFKTKRKSPSTTATVCECRFVCPCAIYMIVCISFPFKAVMSRVVWFWMSAVIKIFSPGQ